MSQRSGNAASEPDAQEPAPSAPSIPEAKGRSSTPANDSTDDELEPQLKYERLGADVKTLLESAAATCLCLSEKILALGTSSGQIHILTYSGDEVKRFQPHSSPVQHLSFDCEAEYIASCANDSFVAISNLYTDETNKYTFKRPIQVVALDPRYSSRKTREFVSGDERGRLKLSSQGWLGRSDHVLHSGEGPIRAVQWQGTVLAWANDVGVKVYDVGSHVMVGSLSRPKSGRHAECFSCHLYLHDESRLYVAWPDCVKVAKVSTHVDAVSGATTKSLHTTSSFTTDYFCMGVVPHGEDLAVLAYMTDAAEQQRSQQGADTGSRPAADASDAPDGPKATLPSVQEAPDSTAGATAAGTAGADAGGTTAPPQEAAEAASSSTVAATVITDAATADAASSGSAAHLDAAATDAPQAGDAAQASTSAVAMPAPSGRSFVRPAMADVVSPDAPGSLAATAASPVPSAALADSAASDAAGATAAGGGTAAMRSPGKPGTGSELPRRGGPAAIPGTPPRPSGPTRAAGTAAAAAKAAGTTTAGASGGSPAGSSGTSHTRSASASASPAKQPSARNLPAASWASSAPSPAAAGAAAGRGSAGAAAAGEAAPYRPSGRVLRPELRIVTTSNVERASDALGIKGYESCIPSDFRLVPSYGNEAALSSRAAGTAAGGAAGVAGAAGGAEGGKAAKGNGTGEFMYFIVSPQDIVIGRYRDAQDRIAWLLAHRRFEEALSLAEADRSLPATLYEAAVQSYLEHLTASPGGWAAAAQQLPRLLKDRGHLWERWVFSFAQARQLPALAGVLPVKRPQLRGQTYEMLLAALLLDPVHHPELLALVQAWPNSLYTPPALIDAIAQRMKRPGGETSALWQALAYLYKAQGRPDLSLAIYLQLQLPSVFEFIQEHNLLSFLDNKAPLLMAIDEARALELLVAHTDAVPPSAVVPALLDAVQAAQEATAAGAAREADATAGSAADAADMWRRRLHLYLHRIFLVDPSAGADYAELQVHLYADYAPQLLADFLAGSQSYPLESALEICEARGLVDEQVFVLSRMGNNTRALSVIIERQQDVPRAIEFVRRQADDELWENLIDWALQSPDTTGQLLEHIGGHINPLRVIEKIPLGMPITRLRDRLRSIIADYRTQTSLREGCNAILRSDCGHLMQKLQREARRALPAVYVLHKGGGHALTGNVAGGVTGGVTSGGIGGVTGGGTGLNPKPGGVQWYRYTCGTGTMAPVSSQEVPPAALAAATASSSSSGGIGGSGTGGSSSAAARGASSGMGPGTAASERAAGASPLRFSGGGSARVWVGYPSQEEGLEGLNGAGSAGAPVTAAQQRQARRSTLSRRERAAAAPAVVLPSLVHA